MRRSLGVPVLLVVALACGGCKPPPKRALPAEMPRTAFPDMRNADAGAADAGETAATESGPSFRSLVVDDAAAYWVADGHTVLAQDKAAAKARVLGKVEAPVIGLALGASAVHLLEADVPGHEGGLVALARASGERASIAKLRGARAMTVDGTYAYVVVDGHQIWRVLLDGGTPKFFAESPVAKAPDAARNTGSGPRSGKPAPAPILALASDDATVYAVTTDAFLRIPKSTGTPARMGPAPAGASELVLTKAHLFVLARDPQAGTPELWAMPKAGPADGAERLDSDDDVRSLASDGAVLYWLGCSDGKDGKPGSCAVHRHVPTGATTTVGSVSDKATSIAARGPRVHVATPEGVTVLTSKK